MGLIRLISWVEFLEACLDFSLQKMLMVFLKEEY